MEWLGPIWWSQTWVYKCEFSLKDRIIHYWTLCWLRNRNSETGSDGRYCESISAKTPYALKGELEVANQGTFFNQLHDFRWREVQSNVCWHWWCCAWDDLLLPNGRSSPGKSLQAAQTLLNPNFSDSEQISTVATYLRYCSSLAHVLIVLRWPLGFAHVRDAGTFGRQLSNQHESFWILGFACTRLHGHF